MLEAQLSQTEEKNRKKAMIISAIIHAALILLAILPLLSYPVPPPGQSGVLVSFGEPDKGRGQDMPATQQEVPEETTQQETEEIEEEQPEPEPEPDPVEESTPTESAAEAAKEVKTSENSDAARIAEQKKKEQERLEEEARKKEAQRQKELEEQRRKEAERKKKEAAERKAEEKRKYEEAKQQYGDLFGKGKGETDEAGNQGDPEGDPNSDVLEGVSTGTGTVGGGLGDRGVASRPTIRDNSQNRGTVVVKVCVDGSGNVISSEYTQRGSSAISDNLRKKSVEAAKKFKFTPSNISKQCGTITFDYRLQ